MSEWQMSFNAACIHHLNCHHGLIFKRIAGWWFQTFVYHNIWDVILPIHELHNFSRWLKHVKTTNQHCI